MGKVLNSLLAISTVAPIGTGGYFLTTAYIIPFFSQSTGLTFSPLRGESYDDDTVGRIYGKYLLGTGKENQRKWEEIYDNNLKLLSSQSISSSVFSDVTTTSKFDESSTSTAALNQQCESRYKLKFKVGEGEESKDFIYPDTKKDEWKALWIMCSPWNPVWATSEELQNVNHRINELLSASGTENDLLWKSKNEDFFSLKTSPSEGVFQTLWESKGKTALKNLKNTCSTVYRTNTQGDVKLTPEELVKYCSMRPII